MGWTYEYVLEIYVAPWNGRDVYFRTTKVLVIHTCLDMNLRHGGNQYHFAIESGERVLGEQ